MTERYRGRTADIIILDDLNDTVPSYTSEQLRKWIEDTDLLFGKPLAHVMLDRDPKPFTDFD